MIEDDYNPLAFWIGLFNATLLTVDTALFVYVVWLLVR